MGKREDARAATTATIITIARRHIAEGGGASLSMRAVAREAGMVSSAIHRYFPTREALLTALIIESYHALAAALRDVPTVDDRAEQWRRLAQALRGWARVSPHEYQLIYGTPIPDYVAPPETVPAAAAVAARLLQTGACEDVPEFTDIPLSEGMAAVLTDLPQSGVAAVLAELAALTGFVSLELAGHFVGTVASADNLFAALVNRQTQTLKLTRRP